MYNIKDITSIYTQPLLQLIDNARSIHLQMTRTNPEQAKMEMCNIISVKTGGCPEDCSYCSQSNQHKTQIKINPLLANTEVEKQIKYAKQRGVTRVCLGAAYKSPPTKALNKICEYIKVIKYHKLEACATLGSITLPQAQQLKYAGLDFYNHNIDTSPEYYKKIVTTHTFADRVATIANVGRANLKICCGGILGLGENRQDRIKFIKALIDLPYVPESIPINLLVNVPGTKLANVPPLDKFEMVRTIATLRTIFPTSRIRLSAGRKDFTQLEQALCFLAGANSIWYGDTLLTTPNTAPDEDEALLAKLGMEKYA